MTGLTISAIQARAVIAPLRRPITTAVASIPAAPLMLIDVDTDQGITGRRCLFAYTPLMFKPLVALLDDLAEILAGQTIAPRVLMATLEDRFRLLGGGAAARNGDGRVGQGLFGCAGARGGHVGGTDVGRIGSGPALL